MPIVNGICDCPTCKLTLEAMGRYSLENIHNKGQALLPRWFRNRLTSVPMTKTTIDQTGHGPHARRMTASMMAIRLRQRLVVSQPSNAMFHHDASSRERPIVLH